MTSTKSFFVLVFGLAFVWASCTTSTDDALEPLDTSTSITPTDTSSDDGDNKDTSSETDTGSDTGEFVIVCDNPPVPPELGYECTPSNVDSDAPACVGDPIGISAISCRFDLEPAAGYYCKYNPGFVAADLCPDVSSLPADGDACQHFPMAPCYYDNGDGTAERWRCTHEGCGAHWKHDTIGGDLAACETCDPDNDKCKYDEGFLCLESGSTYTCQKETFQGNSACEGTDYLDMFTACIPDLVGMICPVPVGFDTYLCTCDGWIVWAS